MAHGAGTTGRHPPESFREGVKAGLPLGLATLIVGISFGVLARSLGWGIVAPIVFSLIVFSGSAQFAVASVLGGGGGVAPAVLAAALVNARFLPMGLALGPSLHGGRLRRAIEGQAMVDASWVIAARGDGRFSRPILLGATLPQFLAWQLGTVIGVLGGGALGDAERYGLDAVFPAFFVALLAAELRNRRAIAVAALAAAITLALIPVAPVGLPVVAAAAAALLGLRGP
jgi:4-azaleucine resistance transporter AzlC